MNIILIGFMGVGKSTVGRLLAAELKMHFVDTDDLIEKSENKTISEIFKEVGENGFRGIETGVLETLQDYDNFVVSVGGGAILKAENVNLLKGAGKIILLWTEPEVVYSRIKNQTHRPLLQVADPKTEIFKILKIREPLYRKAADKIIDTSNLTIDQAVKGVIEWIKSQLI